MSIYLDEKNPGKHPPFDDASPDIVEYVRYLEVIAGKSANTAFSAKALANSRSMAVGEPPR